MLDLEINELSRIEAISLRDLKRINREARNFQMDLILIGGYAIRAFTRERSWRFTKDIDFITTRRDLTALRGMFDLFGYDFERTDFGVKGSKRINSESIELHISVDKVIDWSTGLEYKLSLDIFAKANRMKVKAFLKDNKNLETDAMVAPIEDVLAMKLMTERIRDHFDAIALIFDSFEIVDTIRFWINCEKSSLKQHVKKKLESLLADTKRGLVRKIWKEFTGMDLIRAQEVTLKERITSLLAKS